MGFAWGVKVRLAGGHLTHWAGADQDGSTYLAHDAYAWTDTLRPASDNAPECRRCLRRLPVLAHQVQRAIEEDIARRCDCGRLAYWPQFTCQCGREVAA